MSFIDFCIAEVHSLEKMRRRTRRKRARGVRDTHCWNLWQQILELVQRLGVGSHSNGYGTVKGSQRGFQHEYGTAKGIHYEINTLLACHRKPFITSSLLLLQPFLVSLLLLPDLRVISLVVHCLASSRSWHKCNILNWAILIPIPVSHQVILLPCDYILLCLDLYLFRIFLNYLFYCKLKVCCGYASGL